MSSCSQTLAVLYLLIAVGGSAAAFPLAAKHRDSMDGAPQYQQVEIEPDRTLVVVIDMWDRHWCKTYSERVGNMVPRMNEILTAFRKLGVQVVMAPSDVADFYANEPQRRAMEAIPESAGPAPVDFNPPTEPTGKDGCECGPDTPCTSHKAWTRQHPDLVIGNNDLIGDTNNARELLNLVALRNIDTIIYLGVASNICVCHRDFGMFNMRRHGIRTFFVRDLVESITANGLDPATGVADANFTPAKGTHRTERYLEAHVSPSFESGQILRAAGMGPDDKRPHVVFVIAEKEYNTRETLPAFAKNHLESRIRCTFLVADDGEADSIPGLHALYDADALVLSVRRRFLPVPQMDHLERFLRSGKPVIALRVSAVAFAEGAGETRSETGRVVWQNFDQEVLGCRYQGYDSAARETGSDIWSEELSADHPILQGIEDARFHTPAWIYRVAPLAPGSTVLLQGRWNSEQSPEPVAWTYDRGEGRVFYTSLGHPADFENPAFTRLLVNALDWSLDQHQALPESQGTEH